MKYDHIKQIASDVIALLPNLSNDQRNGYLNKILELYADKHNKRSMKQLNLYWATSIPTIIKNLPEQFRAVSDNLKEASKDIHFRLKLSFCLERRNDLLEQRTIVNARGTRELGYIPFSAALDQLPQKDFNEYMSYVSDWMKKFIGVTIEELK